MDRRPQPPRAEAEQLAHELNNLLAIIGGHADALEPALPSDGPDHESLDAIQRAVRTAASIAVRVRKLAPAPPPQVRGIDAGPLVAAAARAAARRFGQRLTVVATPTPSLWSASLSAAAIETVLEHLVDRVAEPMPHGAVLTIRSMNVETGATPRHSSSRRDRWVRVELSGATLRQGISASPLAPDAGTEAALDELTRAGGRIQVETDGATVATWVLLLPSDGVEPLPAAADLPLRTAELLAEVELPRRHVAGTVPGRHGYGDAIGFEAGETA
jgi:signal transduction histidine kinase